MPYVESFNATCDWNAWALVLDLDTREKVEGHLSPLSLIHRLQHQAEVVKRPEILSCNLWDAPSFVCRDLRVGLDRGSSRMQRWRGRRDRCSTPSLS